MKHILLKTFSMILLCMIFLSACQGNREMVNTFGYYDTDGDYQVDRDEFNTVFANQGDYDSWDIDKDRRLTEDEWEKGFNNYSSSYPYEERGLFDDWDTNNDTYVDDNEYNEGFFGLWDKDDDGFIRQDEWDRAGD